MHDEHSRVVDELDRMRGTLFDHDSLLDEYSRRLHDEQEAQAIARGDQVRAEEAKRVAERNLEVATESARVAAPTKTPLASTRSKRRGAPRASNGTG